MGSRYSGAAWATVADFEAEQINPIASWPGTGREEGKAPTKLFYEYDHVMSGFNIPADVNPIRWFKLLLLREQDLTGELRESEFLIRARKMMREQKKNLNRSYCRLSTSSMRTHSCHNSQSTRQVCRGRADISRRHYRTGNLERLRKAEYERGC
jgi:hypothetical protein